MSELALLDLPRLFAGLLMLTLAFWALALDIRSPLMRLFALFMVLRGLLNILLPFTVENPKSWETLDAWTSFSTYFQIAVPFAAIAFAVRLIHPEGGYRRLQWSLLGIAVLLSIVYLFDHSLFWGVRGDRGPMFIVMSFGTLAYMVVGHIMILHARGSRPLFLAGIAYALFPVFAAGVDLGAFMVTVEHGNVDKITPLKWLFNAIRLASLVYAGIIITALARLGNRRRLIGGTMAIAATFALGLVAYVWTLGNPEPGYWEVAAPLNGFVTALLPVAIGWAIASDAFYGRGGDVRMSMGRVALLFTLVWLMIIAALLAGIYGLPGVAVLIGTIAIALLLFLLLQSRNMGVGLETT